MSMYEEALRRRKYWEDRQKENMRNMEKPPKSYWLQVEENRQKRENERLLNEIKVDKDPIINLILEMRKRRMRDLDENY